MTTRKRIGSEEVMGVASFAAEALKFKGAHWAGR